MKFIDATTEGKYSRLYNVNQIKHFNIENHAGNYYIDACTYYAGAPTLIYHAGNGQAGHDRVEDAYQKLIAFLCDRNRTYLNLYTEMSEANVTKERENVTNVNKTLERHSKALELHRELLQNIHGYLHSLSTIVAPSSSQDQIREINDHVNAASELIKNFNGKETPKEQERFLEL